MSHELYYTSLPAGLKPGSNGFCTVAATAGLPGAMAQRMEMLSGYRDLYPPGNARAARNPVAWSHWRLSPGGRGPSILSRVGSAGMDYTGRSNTFAHHLLLDPAEQPAAGPAWLLSQPGVLDVAWTGSPRIIPAGRPVPLGDDPPAACDAWSAATGDAGWAGVLAATAAADVPRVAYLIYDPAAGHDPFPLLREAMALLPPARRWPVAFTTYFTDLPAGLACHWRCCVAGTPAAKDARRNATSGVVLDLTGPMGDVPESALARVARTGHTESSATAAAVAAPPIIATATGHTETNVGLADPTEPMPLPVGSHAAGRLTPRRRPAISFAGSPGGAPPSLPMGILVDGPADLNVAPQVRSTQTWLWVAAFVWPLLVIPAVIAWHVSAESERNRLLTVQDADLKAKVKELGEAAVARNQDLAVAQKAADDARKKLDQVDGTLKAAQDQLAKAELQVQHLQDEALRMAQVPPHASGTKPNSTSQPVAAALAADPPARVTPATVPSPVPPPSAVPAPDPSAMGLHLVPADPLAVAPLLYSSDVAIDSLTLVAGLPDKSFTFTPKGPSPVGTPIQISWTGSEAVPIHNDANAIPSITTVSVAFIVVEKRLDCWAVFWRWDHKPKEQTTRANALERWLRYSGLSVTSQGRRPVMVALGDPSASFAVNATRPQPLPDFQPPVHGGSGPVITVEAEDQKPWVIRLDPDQPDVVDAVYSTQPNVAFTVTLDPKGGTLSSTYAQVLQAFADALACLETERQLDDAVQAKHAQHDADFKMTTIDPKAVNDRKAKLGSDDSDIRVAEQHRTDVNNQRATLKNAQAAMGIFKPFTIRLRDADTGVLLREIKVSAAPKR